MNKLWARLVLVVVIEMCAASASTPVVIKSSGDTVVSSRFGEVGVRVKIRTHELPNGTTDKPLKPPDSSCTMSRMPCSVVDSIEISVAGAPVFVPRSVFADLADVNNAELAMEKGRYVLTLIGGDASESYIVKIVFNRTRITYRSLTSGEFPEHPLQETIYHSAD